MVSLLRTKFFIPRPRENLVLRPGLVERLNAGLHKKLTLIAAPAGFGKTTLLSEWIPKSPRSVSWLFLDEGDNDPAQFWAYFFASLQELSYDLGAKGLAQVRSPQPLPIKSILTELINDLIAFAEPFASVLDDYHFIESQEIHDALAFLIDHLPANMHLVITTREDPPLPLARLRARDHLTEIRARDLRFTQVETEAFLRGVMGLDLSNQEIAALGDRTEGWVTGLQLAGLSMQRQPNQKAFIADFSGSHRHILDYLTDEVLQRQPESTRTFLLQTAILDRLSGPLCDAITERSGSDELLAHLEASNLFVTPLDEERRWFRYHQLFSDLLRNQLARAHPQWIPELHLRASRWYEANGDIQAAVEHALQNPDLTAAARLIEEHTLPKLYQGEVAMVTGWFDKLPEAILESAPMLCISKAWALVLLRRSALSAEVERALHAAERALDVVRAGPALRDLVAGHVAVIRAFLLRTPMAMGKNPEKIIALSREAQRLLPENEQAIRSTAALNIGYGYQALADLETASRAFQQALEEGLSGGNYFAAIYGPINMVLNALLVGHLREALQLCETYIRVFNQIQAGKYFPPIGALYIYQGSILLEYDCLQEAEQALTEGLDLVRWTGELMAPKKGYTALARLHAIQGDRPGMLEAARALEESWPEGALYAQSLRHCLSLRLAPDDPDVRKEAAAWLAQSGIDFGERVVIDSVDHNGRTYFVSYLNAAHVLAHLAKGKPAIYPLGDALSFLKRQLEFAASHGFASEVVDITLARTLLYQASGKTRDSLDSLEEALSAAEPTGLFRVFVDECDSLLPLLEQLKPRLVDEDLILYANLLIDRMSHEPARPESSEAYPQRLSERELEVLRNLSSGLSYEDIGRQLYLSLNTVQFHVKNIYRKLLVNKRVQAVERARELRLI